MLNIVKGKFMFSLYLMVWLLTIVLLWIYWWEIPTYLAWIISIIEIIFAPDFKSVKMLFKNNHHGE